MNSQSTIALTTEIGRTDYRDGGVLSAAALAGDSEANLSAWEGHQKNAHIGGIVAGLFVEPPIGKIFKVTPGAAIDSDGRMLLVDHDLTSPSLKEDSKSFALWLRYSVESEAAPESDLQRYRETPRLEVIALDDLPDSSESFASSGVLLAYLREDKETAGVLKVDASCRRYVGAVGNRIDAPSGRARVVLGPQFPRDPRRFAIGVQAAATQPIRDVFTWESTGTIRLSARTSVALPHEKEKPAEVEQPAIMIVGAPTVYFTTEDILDPCQVWTRLIIKGEDGKGVMPSELLDPLSDGDRIALATRPACRVTGQALLQRSLNRLIRKAAEDVLDLVTRRKFEPAAQTIVVDENGNEFTVNNVDVVTKTFDIVGANETLRKGVSWQGFWPRDWSPAVFLTDRKLPVELPKELRRMLSYWRALPGDYMCRVLLDDFLGDAIKPLESPAPRGLYFNGSVPIAQEPSASRIHLVEFKKDGQTFRQLRITIPDPGKENNPHRYRCSIGTAPGCTDPPAPEPTKKIWNRQTSWPRGILSVLADKSIDIHKQLNVYPVEGSVLQGLILELKPESDLGTGDGSSDSPSIPATQILGNAVVWEGQRVQRGSADKVIIDGSLRNLTDVPVNSLQVLVSIYGQNETDKGVNHIEVVPKHETNRLEKKSNTPIKQLTSPFKAGETLSVPIPEAFKSKTIIVSLLVMGVNSQNFIICSQYIEELPVPGA